MMLSMPQGRPFRILQITDFHNDRGEELARRTWQDIEAMAARWQPDFLAVTGDIWCGDDQPENAAYLMERDLARLAALNIPWAFTWGNHDHVESYAASHADLLQRPNCAMTTGSQLGSYRVRIAAARHEPWDLFFINTRGLWHPEEDWQWFEEETNRLRDADALAPALAFYHIPLWDYEDARQKGEYVGVAHEEVLCWGDDGTGLKRLAEHGRIRAGFCGHSHKCDFYFERAGITLAYGRVTGHGGYGGETLAKGAKIIDLDEDGTLDFFTIFADGATWRPEEPGA